MDAALVATKSFSGDVLTDETPQTRGAIMLPSERCESVPKWDPSQKDGNALISLQSFVSGGVRVGADQTNQHRDLLSHICRPTHRPFDVMARLRAP